MATVQGGWAAKNGRTWLRRSLLRNTTAPELDFGQFWVTRCIRLIVGRAIWGCSDRREGRALRISRGGARVSFVPLVGSDDPLVNGPTRMAGLFRMSPCRRDVTKPRWAGPVSSQPPARIGQSRAEASAPWT